MITHYKFSVFVILQATLILSLAVTCAAQGLLWKYPTGTHVNSVSVSADGSLFVSGNQAGSIDFYDTKRSHETYMWRTAARDQVRSVAISEDGAYVVAGGNDGVVYFIDREFVRRFPIWKFQTAGTVFSVAISGNGSSVVAGSYDHKLYLMDNQLTGEAPLWSFHTGGNVRSVAISKDGTSIFAGSDDNYLYFFENSFRGNTYLWRLETAASPVAVAISADGNYAVAGCKDGHIYFVDQDFSHSGQLWRYQVEDSVTSVAISSDGSYIAVGSTDGCLYLFDRGLTGNSWLWNYSAGKPVDTVAMSKDGLSVACAAGNSVHFFETVSKGEKHTSCDTDAEVTAISVSSSGEVIVAGDENGLVYVVSNPRVNSHVITTTELGTSTGEIIHVSRPIDLNIILAIVILAAFGSIGLTIRKRGQRKRISGPTATLSRPSTIEPAKTIVRAEVPETCVGMISTGTRILDELTQGGFPKSCSVVLSSPSCDQSDQIVHRFLDDGLSNGRFALSLTMDMMKFKDLIQKYPETFRVLFCNPQAEEIDKSLWNVSKTKGVDNVTDINITLMKIVDSLIPEQTEEARIYVDILSDMLVHHGVPTTRRWVSETVPRLKARGFTVLGMINASMHKKEETEAITSVFDGEIEIFDRRTDGSQRLITVRRMYGRKHSYTESFI